jgi:hypothetical protein
MAPISRRTGPLLSKTLSPDEELDKLDFGLGKERVRPEFARAGPRVVPAAGLLPTSPAEMVKLAAALEEHSRLQWLILLAQSPMPTTRFGARLLGSAIGTTNRYVSLYENSQPHPVAVKVLYTVGIVPGTQVALSTSQDTSNESAIDYLGNTSASPSFGKVISDNIILKAKQTLYINTADTAFTLDANDIFRVRVFDPSEFLKEDSWQRRSK